MRYIVNEIYPCLQGEGLNLGLPSLLVRFQICNLRCHWCDTPYTHTLLSDPADSNTGEKSLRKKQKFSYYTLSDLVATITKPGHPHHIILSGGEPTIHNLADIVSALPAGYSYEVETNGTTIPHEKHKSFTLEHYAKFHWNISPKGNNAGETYNWDALEFWGQMVKKIPSLYFKFVIRQEKKEDDIAEALHCMDRLFLPRDRVIFMAEGVTQKSQLESHWLHNLCSQMGVRYSPRLHVLLFGSERGV